MTHQSTTTRRHFLELVGGAGSSTLPLFSRQNSDKRQRELAELSKKLGREYGGVVYNGKKHHEEVIGVLSSEYFIVMSSKPQKFIHSFLLIPKNFQPSDRAESFELMGEAREVRGLDYLVNYPSNTQGTVIPNPVESDNKYALVHQYHSSRFVDDYKHRSLFKYIKNLVDLADVANAPLDTRCACYTITERAKERVPQKHFERFTGKAPADGQFLLSVIEDAKKQQVEIHYTLPYTNERYTKNQAIRNPLVRSFTREQIASLGYARMMHKIVGSRIEPPIYDYIEQGVKKAFEGRKDLELFLDWQKISRQGNLWLPKVQSYGNGTTSIILAYENGNMRIAYIGDSFNVGAYLAGDHSIF